METNELQYLFDHSPLLTPLRGRVCAKDQLSLENGVKAYIVNTHNSNQPGEHWVAIYLNGSTAVYFDSYGRPPFDEILTFMKKYSNKIVHIWNTLRVQGSHLPVCGLYCIFALDFLSRGCDLNEVLKTRFNMEDMEQNDVHVTQWFGQYYGTYYRHAQKVNKSGQICCTEDSLQRINTEMFHYLVLHKHRTYFGL